MIRRLFSTVFRTFILIFLSFAIQPDSSEAQTSIKERALRQVVMLHSSIGIDDLPGAGLIVGEDSAKIYIATAASFVTDNDGEAKVVEFRHYPGVYWLSSTHESEHSFEKLGIAVITVDKQAAFPVEIEEVQRSLWDVSPSTVRFVGNEGETSRWKVTSNFSRSPEPKLEFSAGHQLHEKNILTRTFFNLEGYKGGAMFDLGWRLFGIVLDDEIFKSAIDQNGGEEVFDDEFTTTLSIQKLIDVLQEMSVPVSQHLLTPKAGAIFGKEIGYSINIAASVTRNDQTNKLNIHLSAGNKYDGSPVTYTIQAKDRGQWKEYESGEITGLVSMSTQEQEFILPKAVTDIRFCYAHRYMRNRYAFLTGATKIYLLDEKDPLSKYLFRNGQPIHLMAISSPKFTSRGDTCEVEFGNISNASEAIFDLKKSQQVAITNKKLLDLVTLLRGAQLPLFPQNVTIGLPTNFKLKRCLNDDQLPGNIVFRLYPKHYLKDAGGFRLYTKIAMEGESEFVVRADVDDIKYGAIVQTIKALSSRKLRNLDTCMVSDLDDNRKIGVMNHYIVNEPESLRDSGGATYSIYITQVLDADQSLYRIKVRTGKGDREVCPGFAEVATDPEPVSCPAQYIDLRGSVSQGLLDSLGRSSPRPTPSSSSDAIRAPQPNLDQSNSLPSGCLREGLPGDAINCN